MTDQERIRVMRRVDVLWVALEELREKLNGEPLGASAVSVYAADLRDALELLDAIALGWLPIDTAPRDGTMVLLWHRNGDNATASYALGWHEKRGWEDGRGSLEPSHWTPLPEPPPAIATEAGTATTPKSGVVHEGAGPEDIAHD